MTLHASCGGLARLLFRHRLPSNRSIEHPTQCLPIDDAGVNSESNDAPRVLIHNDQYPVRPQGH
jgi:hypothetical protein